MKTAEFNENFELDRRTRGGVRANPKHAPAPPEIMTADGAVYDSNQKYYFFDAQVQEIKQSLGLKRDGEYFCTFGLRVIAVSKPRINRDDALANGQNLKLRRCRIAFKVMNLKR